MAYFISAATSSSLVSYALSSSDGCFVSNLEFTHPLQNVSHVCWSPDALFIAVATPQNIYLFDPSGAPKGIVSLNDLIISLRSKDHNGPKDAHKSFSLNNVSQIHLSTISHCAFGWKSSRLLFIGSGSQIYTYDRKDAKIIHHFSVVIYLHQASGAVSTMAVSPDDTKIG